MKETKHREDVKKIIERKETIKQHEPIQLEVGIALLPLFQENEEIKQKIKSMRMVIEKELGIQIPNIRVMDNAAIMPFNKYQIKMKDQVVAEGEVRKNKLLAMKTPYVMSEIQGEKTKDPIYGEDALWIEEEMGKEAIELGYILLEPTSIIVSHLNETVVEHIHKLITRQDVSDMLERLKNTHPVLIKEMEDKNLDYPCVQRVIQNLLIEKISIEDMPTIIEYMLDAKEFYQNSDDITSFVREKMGQIIVNKKKGRENKLIVHYLEKSWEEKLNETIFLYYHEYQVGLANEEKSKFISMISHNNEKAVMENKSFALIVEDGRLRMALSRMFKEGTIKLTVLTKREISTQTQFDVM